MCNLYSITAAREAMLRMFRVGHNRAGTLAPLQAIFPGHVAPVVRLADDGLVYRGSYLVNWSPRLRTAVSDLEVEYSEEKGKLYYFRYPVAREDGSLSETWLEDGDFLPVAGNDLVLMFILSVVVICEHVPIPSEEGLSDPRILCGMFQFLYFVLLRIILMLSLKM